MAESFVQKSALLLPQFALSVDDACNVNETRLVIKSSINKELTCGAIRWPLKSGGQRVRRAKVIDGLWKSDSLTGQGDSRNTRRTLIAAN